MIEQDDVSLRSVPPPQVVAGGQGWCRSSQRLRSRCSPWRSPCLPAVRPQGSGRPKAVRPDDQKPVVVRKVGQAVASGNARGLGDSYCILSRRADVIRTDPSHMAVSNVMFKPGAGRSGTATHLARP